MAQRRIQIFVSHSQYDRDIRASFDTVFARTGVRSVCMEFELIYPPAWQAIKNEIQNSATLFLLLGPNIRSSIHTQNWVAFEVGLACALGRDVWVFEQDGSHIEFPIPYLTDYMIYNLEDANHFNYVRSIIEGYANPTYLLSFQDTRTQRNIPRGMPLTCPHQNCGSHYSLHTEVKSLSCPSCRQQIESE
jgi:hypothetical protein